MRIKFNGHEKQREFIRRVLEEINCPSLKELINRGMSVNYSTLKNYYNGSRLISEDFFNELIELSGLSKEELDFEVVGEHWGQVLGGRRSKRK